MNGYDSVFANAKDEELEFEVMFDQEDDLIDTIVGCNENGDPLTGADPCSATNAEERSSSDDNPDYEKDIDADDTEAPKDAEGTVGYDFEDEPEIKGDVDDQTTVDAKDVKIEEEADFDFEVTVPKDAEGTVGYDFEVNPEVGSKDDQTEVDVKDVKVEEEVELDYEGITPDQTAAPEGSEKTIPAGPTDVATDCGDGGCPMVAATNVANDCGGTCATKEVSFDFENEAAEPEEVEIKKIDKDVEEIEDVEGYLDDDAIEDAETKDPDPNLDYDISDEEVIDYVINNK